MLAALPVGVGCATKPRVWTDFDASVDFATFRTFAWSLEHPLLVAAATQPVNPLLEPRIKAAFEARMKEKGLTRVDDPEVADLLVLFTVGSRDQIRIDSVDYGTYPTGHRGGWERREVRARTYVEGQLAIDLYDRQSRAPVWHGTSTDTIRQRDRENQQALVDRMVTAIMDRYPPR